MTAREHAEEAARAASDAELRASWLKDSGITFAMQAAQAHALTAIALVMTDADSIDYATIAQEAAIGRLDHVVLRHVNDVVRRSVDYWAETPAARDLIARRIAEYLELNKDRAPSTMIVSDYTGFEDAERAKP